MDNQVDRSDSQPDYDSDGGQDHGHTVTSGVRARGAVKLGTMRYVLGVSLGLAVVVMALAYLLIVVLHR